MGFLSQRDDASWRLQPGKDLFLMTTEIDSRSNWLHTPATYISIQLRGKTLNMSLTPRSGDFRKSGNGTMLSVKKSEQIFYTYMYTIYKTKQLHNTAYYTIQFNITTYSFIIIHYSLEYYVILVYLIWFNCIFSLS